MKRLLTTLVILTGLFAPSLAVAEEGVQFDELVERDGLCYEKFADEPFTGKTVGLRRYAFLNGKKHGPSFRYYENGQLNWKETWKNGKGEGPSVWYFANGMLQKKETFKDGKREGSSVAYHEDGLLWWKGTFKDGKREGSWVMFQRDGTIDTNGILSMSHEGSGTYLNDKKVSD
ncbi:hypothetical protein N9F34_04465 [Alphaproteobacteria bacterium]|nr:hypothetical protein [Alphaproteobacteria bacterium]